MGSPAQMAAKTLTEAIALTEKKMDMTLDDIIKMSKKSTSKGKKPPRTPNKSRGFLNARAPLGNSKVRQFMDSRSSIRQGVLAQRRSNFRGNLFPLTTEVARKAAVLPIRNKMVNRNMPRVAAAPLRRNNVEGSSTGMDKVLTKQRPQTLDARFANIKEQRMRVMSQQQQLQLVRGAGRQTGQRRRVQQQQQQQRGRGGGAAPGGSARRFANYGR